MPPTFATIRQPNVRAGTTWTPARVRTALSTADGGYLANLARLCEEMLGDDTIPSLLESRIDGLLSLPLSFEEPGRTKPQKKRDADVPKGAQVKALDDDGDWWRLFPKDQLKQVMAWGLLLGGCPCRLVEDEDSAQNGRIVPHLEFWHPQHLRRDNDGDRWLIKTGKHGVDEVEFTPGRDGWLLFAPFGERRFWAHGLWRGLERWWLAKSYSIDDWARHNEVGALLTATNTSSNPAINDTRQIRAEIASDLSNRGGDAAMALPAGWELGFTEVTADTRRIYQALIECANKTFAVKILGQNLTTEVKGGSFAAAKVHESVLDTRIAGDAEYEATFAHDQALSQWAELNYGSRDLAPWPLRDTEPPEDQSARATVIETISRAVQSLDKTGIALDLEVLRDEYHLPIAEDQPEPAPAPPQPPQNPPPPPTEQQGEPGANVAPGAPQARLMSGDDPRLASGMVEGQQYADELGDEATAQGADALEPFLDNLSAAIDGIESLEQAREVIVQFYRDSLPPDQLDALTARVMTLAAVAGHTAVQQDAPELRTTTDG